MSKYAKSCHENPKVGSVYACLKQTSSKRIFCSCEENEQRLEETLRYWESLCGRSRGAGSPAFLSITSSSKDTSPRELLLATAELRKRQQNHSKEVSITGKRLAELLAEACAHEVVLTQRLQDVEAQDVFAQLGGGKGNESREKRLEEHAAPMLSSPEQGQGEQKEDVYAGLEVYGEYR